MPDKFIDLKRTDSDKTDEALLVRESDDQDYPWGLSISLEKEELEKLGITEMNVGDEFEMNTLVRVKGFSEDASDDGDVRRSARLLIKAVAMPSTEKKTPAETLYGPGEGAGE